MAFIKHGDGKIVSVLKEDTLTDEQKKSIQDKSAQAEIKQSETTDTSVEQKKSGN